MTADELLHDMDNVTRGGLAQKGAREKFRQQLVGDTVRHAMADGMTRKQAKAYAEALAGGRDVIGVGPDGLPSMAIGTSTAPSQPPTSSSSHSSPRIRSWGT